MGRFVCLVPVLFARLSLALVYHVTVKGLLYCIMLQKPQSCPKGPQGLFPKKMSGVGKDRVVIYRRSLCAFKRQVKTYHLD